MHQRRNLLLLVDNASSHAVPGAEAITMEGLQGLKLVNLTILFLPSNTSSAVQPLDQGVIASFKAR